MLEFIVGDMVVIPGCGVGAIEDIEVVDLGEETVRTYKIYVKATAMHMWIPVSIAASKGLRAPVDLKRLKVLFEAIRQTTAPAKRTNWNQRQRRYNEQLMSADPLDLAQLLGELSAVKHGGKTLSFGERRLFDRARDLFQSEVDHATDDAEKAAAQLEAALAA